MRILHTNDFHGSLKGEVFERLAGLRAGVDVYFDSGDCVKSGNLSIPFKPEPVWPLLARLDCTASVPGNRESHPLEAGFKAKLAGRTHQVLCCNLADKRGRSVLPPSMTLEVGGVKVGVLGTMVAMVTKRMATSPASNYLWSDPVEAAIAEARSLRRSVDVLIALTHIGHRRDRELAEACGEIDIVLGGHSHTVVETPERVGRTWVCQGGSHGKYAGVYEWSGGALSGGLVRLSP